MPLISLDGSQFSDIDTFLLGALTLAAATGQGFELAEVGRISGSPGVSALHLTAMRALAALCGAEMKGEAIRAKTVRFVPGQPPRARDLTVDTGEALGRPSPAPVSPLIEALLPVLARAGGDSLVRLRGANATPGRPSAFWLRETFAPMVGTVGVGAAVEIERWGWHPDGGGETTLLVEERRDESAAQNLIWEERGDPVALWGVAALSPRLDERIGQQLTAVFERETARDPLGPRAVEMARVRSPGPGSGLFLALQFEQVAAGFEAVAHGGMSAEQVARDAAAAMSQFFWSDAAFEPELARSMMVPLALSGRPARFTTSELTPPMRVLETLIPRFLPVRVTLAKHPTGGLVTLEPQGTAKRTDVE